MRYIVILLLVSSFNMFSFGQFSLFVDAGIQSNLNKPFNYTYENKPQQYSQLLKKYNETYGITTGLLLEYNIKPKIRVGTGIKAAIARRVVTYENNTRGIDHETGNSIIVEPYSTDLPEAVITLLFPLTCKYSFNEKFYSTLGINASYSCYRCTKISRWSMYYHG